VQDRIVGTAFVLAFVALAVLNALWNSYVKERYADHCARADREDNVMAWGLFGLGVLAILYLTWRL
jgi:hypothetical protein